MSGADAAGDRPGARGGLGAPGRGLGRSFFTTGRGKAIIPTAIILAVLLFLFWQFASFATDWMWFSSLGATSVIRTRLLTQGVLLLVFGLLTAAVVVVNFLLAYRKRPVYAVVSAEQQTLERYRSMIAPFRKWAIAGLATLLGLLVGLSAATQWQTFLLWRHGTEFGIRDPQFNKDIGFYMFDLPWWYFLLSFVVTMLMISLLVALVSHYLYGGLRVQGAGERTTVAARVHLSVLLGLFVLAKAVQYWLDRYALATQYDRTSIGNSGQGFTGLSYTDVHAVIGAKYALAVIALICALLFFFNIVRKTWLLPVVGVGLLLISSIVIGGVVPSVVQRFQVRPSEIQKESPYLARHIEATRHAYGIDTVQVREFSPQTQQVGKMTTDQVAGARLTDPYVVSPSFRQQQRPRDYYQFASALDIDRYAQGDRTNEIVVGVRELNPAGQPARNWINDHTVYTHGFGLVAAASDSSDPNGAPNYVESNIPTQGQLTALGYEPRIYFGETSPEYSIVGGPAGEAPREVDYQKDAEEVRTTYQGNGGVAVGSLWRKTLFAVKYQEEKILLSSGVNSQSRILFERNPRDRVMKIAPWLRVDTDPYPAVINGRVQWILDGYTTSAGYPYSLHTNLASATSDSLDSRKARQANEQMNYIRNSVKATVDAYDGTVSLYAWDEADPVLKAWRGAFPDVVKDRTTMSPELLAHVRYPEDMFKVQRTLLGNYHQTDPGQFYSSSDFWETPADPSTATTRGAKQPPYYLTINSPETNSPNAGKPTFSLTTTFVPRERQNLAAFASVNSQPGEGYGTITVLRMKTNTQIPGPEQFVQTWENNERINRQLMPLRTGGKQTIVGNVLTLPVGDRLVYVAPVYVLNASYQNAFPLMQLVVTSSGNQIGAGQTLQQALDDMANSAPVSNGGGTPTTEQSTPGGTPSGTPAPGATPSGAPPTVPPVLPAPDGPVTLSPEASRALNEALQAQQDAEKALAKPGGPDWDAYAAAQKRLKAALDRAARASRPATPAPTPSPMTVPAAPA